MSPQESRSVRVDFMACRDTQISLLQVKPLLISDPVDASS
jgi:hypothetical protein